MREQRLLSRAIQNKINIETNKIMRTIAFSIFCLFLQLGLAAQNEVTVLSGKLFYYPQAGSNPILKYAGTQLELKGKFRCKGSESAKLFYNGHYFWVTGSKLRNVQDVVNAAVKTNEMSFTGRFFNFLTESVKEGENTENVKKYHRKYMNKSSGGVKGFGPKPGYEITPLFINSGKLPPENVIFKWRNTTGEGPYTFHLFSQEDKMAATLLVRDTAITLDLDQLALNLDEEYSWNVTRGESAKSESLPFEICPNSVVERQTDLSHETAFQKADHTEQQLMLAYMLEEEHCFYAANNTYARMIADDADNALVRKMYASFFARMDMLPEAISLLSNAPK